MNCGKLYKYDPSQSRGKFCSNRCQGELTVKTSVTNWLQGIIPGWAGKTRNLKSFVRKWLKDTRGSACSKCGWDENHPSDGRSLTEINHIDGDAENCTPQNLEILCPNCHSMTTNYKNRNKSSKRNRK